MQQNKIDQLPPADIVYLLTKYFNLPKQGNQSALINYSKFVAFVEFLDVFPIRFKAMQVTNRVNITWKKACTCRTNQYLFWRVSTANVCQGCC